MPEPQFNWPPNWLKSFYCNWVNRINQVAVVLALTGLSVLIGGIAYTIISAELAKG
ncbi:MAG: hypothetical protein QNL04_10425 [SAR324 cluster bacterium]|nr:hypothetical protein [SAR324 cluster bacterium]